MNNAFVGLMVDSIPTLVSHTHFNFNLQGWPAAFTAVAFMGACVAVYAITVNQVDSREIDENSKNRKTAVKNNGSIPDNKGR